MKVVFEKYKTIERRLYVKKGTILIEKIDKKNRYSYKRLTYQKEERKYKPSKITSEKYHDELAYFKPVPEKLEEKRKEVEIEPEEQYDEFEYFIGFDYETPTIEIEGQQVYAKGKHDFKTEFRVSSPVPLSNNEIQKVIQSKFTDYAVLKDSDSYEIKSESKTKSKKKPEFNAKFTEKITR